MLGSRVTGLSPVSSSTYLDHNIVSMLYKALIDSTSAPFWIASITAVPSQALAAALSDARTLEAIRHVTEPPKMGIPKEGIHVAIAAPLGSVCVHQTWPKGSARNQATDAVTRERHSIALHLDCFRRRMIYNAAAAAMEFPQHPPLLPPPRIQPPPAFSSTSPYQLRSPTT